MKIRTKMKLTAFLIALLLVAPARTGAQAFDRSQIEQEVMAVLDAFLDAFNQQDARAEERTYHFPHFRLASGGMSVLDKPGAESQAWMNTTYATLRQSAWDHRLGLVAESSTCPYPHEGRRTLGHQDEIEFRNSHSVTEPHNMPQIESDDTILKRHERGQQVPRQGRLW
jgi:hypothetical protein